MTNTVVILIIAGIAVIGIYAVRKSAKQN